MEANKALERSRLPVTISAISVLRTGTDRARQPARSVWTLGERNAPTTVPPIDHVGGNRSRQELPRDDDRVPRKRRNVGFGHLQRLLDSYCEARAAERRIAISDSSG